MKSLNCTIVTLTLAALAGCGNSADASARSDTSATAAARGTGSRAGVSARMDDPCGVFTPQEVRDLVGARGDLEARPDEPEPGMKSCAWRNRQGEGGLLIVEACDADALWSLNDDERVGRNGMKGCFWQRSEAHQQVVAAIGRQARAWLMQEEDMPSYWVAEALTDAGTVEVWVNESAGLPTAVAFLRAAVERLAGAAG
jgi:hypothetical protein